MTAWSFGTRKGNKGYMTNKHLSYDDGTYRAEIDICPASTDEGIQRGTFIYDPPAEDKHPFRARVLFGNIFYASTVLKLECDGQPIPLDIDTMRKLPDGLTALWEIRVTDLNPQWRPGLTADQLEAIQKKATPLSGGSTTSTEQPAKASKKT